MVKELCYSGITHLKVQRGVPVNLHHALGMGKRWKFGFVNDYIGKDSQRNE